MGMQLSVLHHAGSMRIFHFGEISEANEGVSGQYAMHVQCPWRLLQGDTIITGSGDWYEPVDENIDLDSWEPARGGSVQEKKLRVLLACPEEVSRTIINRTGKYFVKQMLADEVGGCKVVFSENISLILFPSGSVAEAWRLIPLDTNAPHFVVGPQGIDDGGES